MGNSKKKTLNLPYSNLIPNQISTKFYIQKMEEQNFSLFSIRYLRPPESELPYPPTSFTDNENFLSDENNKENLDNYLKRTESIKDEDQSKLSKYLKAMKTN